jgi:signal transduction histidine kinase
MRCTSGSPCWTRGYGIDEATVARVFEPFFTTKKAGEGTGLGLAVVQGIVKSHDGTITIRTKRGEGTRVDVVLPAVQHARAIVA